MGTLKKVIMVSMQKSMQGQVLKLPVWSFHLLEGLLSEAESQLAKPVGMLHEKCHQQNIRRGQFRAGHRFPLPPKWLSCWQELATFLSSHCSVKLFLQLLSLPAEGMELTDSRLIYLSDSNHMEYGKKYMWPLYPLKVGLITSLKR